MSRKDYDMAEARQYVYLRDNYNCQHEDCLETEIELAHRIAKTKANIKMIMKKYKVDKKTAEKIIHHPLNLITSCRQHNDYFNIGNRPIAVSKLLDEIVNEISQSQQHSKL